MHLTHGETRRVKPTPELRDVLIEILKGGLPRAAHRPPSVATHNRRGVLVSEVNRLVREGCDPRDAVEQVAITHGVDEKTVRNAIE